MNIITREEAIHLIENVYHAKADPKNEIFDVFDQLYVCEQLAKVSDTEKATNGNVYVNESDNGTYKRNVNNTSGERKRQIITELKACHYRTPPRRIAKLLEDLFLDHPSKEGHWLYIAQHWNPREINRVIHQMIKQHQSGAQTITNPAAYFTSLIKYRSQKKRRRLRGA